MPVAIDPWRTPKRRLLDVLMVERTGHDVAQYVRSKRAPNNGYRKLAKEITDLTGVDVGPTSLRMWARNSND